MNVFKPATSLAALLAASLLVPTVTLAQAGGARPAGTAAASNPDAPHKVALIDMAQVFKKYKKFEDLRQDLKAEIEQSEALAKQKAEKLQKMQAKLKDLKEGTDLFTEQEKQLAKESAEFEAFRRQMQREFLKKESQIYLTVYQEVTDTVSKYAQHKSYTLVIRFNRDELDTDNPQNLIQGMNRQVVYYRGDDDITDTVLNALNKRYETQASRSDGGATTPPKTATPKANAPR